VFRSSLLHFGAALGWLRSVVPFSRAAGLFPLCRLHGCCAWPRSSRLPGELFGVEFRGSDRSGAANLPAGTFTPRAFGALLFQAPVSSRLGLVFRLRSPGYSRFRRSFRPPTTINLAGFRKSTSDFLCRFTGSVENIGDFGSLFLLASRVQGAFSASNSAIRGVHFGQPGFGLRQPWTSIWPPASSHCAASGLS
jgi:hypothetical protein